MKAYLRIKIKSLATEAAIIRHAEKHWLERGRYCYLRSCVFSIDDLAPRDGRKAASVRAYTTFRGLQDHRHGIAIEQRAALIAYGFLRGKHYRHIERDPHCLKPPFSRQSPDWSRVRDLILKYGEGAHGEKNAVWDKVKAWRDHRPN